MYFSFYKSGINKETNNEGLVPQIFSQPTDHTNVRNEASLQAPNSKKETLEDEHFKLAQHKFLERTENRKSPLPYIGMIAEAINSSPTKKMVLSEIYAYMEHNFFKYLSGKPRWRNTVRHNLSFHNCFVKCECSRRGNRSHFWSIHPDYIEQFKLGNFTKTLSPPREQTNTSPYALELQNSRRNSYENYHRFLPNAGYGNYFHYESTAPFGALYQAIPPPSNVLFPRHDVRSFPIVESSSSRGTILLKLNLLFPLKHKMKRCCYRSTSTFVTRLLSNQYRVLFAPLVSCCNKSRTSCHHLVLKCLGGSYWGLQDFFFYAGRPQMSTFFKPFCLQFYAMISIAHFQLANTLMVKKLLWQLCYCT